MNLTEALQRIADLEQGLLDSKQANKRIKQKAKFTDYNRLLDRFNRQKEQNNAYRDALIEVTECGTLERAEFVALKALEGQTK